MAKRLEQFTNEQIEILLKNPNVADATTNTIKFTPECKKFENSLKLPGYFSQSL